MALAFFIIMFVRILLAGLLLFAIPSLCSQAQDDSCVSTETIGAEGVSCTGYIVAQTFEPQATGWLQNLSIQRCTANETVLTIRELASNASSILDGSLIYTSATHPALSVYDNCSSAESGLDNYELLEINLTPDSIAVSEGLTYALYFESGYGAGNCAADPYQEGFAIGEFGPLFNTDLVFSLTLCETPEEEIVFGCTDNAPNVCNYDPLANANDGSCIVSDCMGICGGSAHILPGCGCVDGTSPIAAEDCYGCTDPAACNFVSLQTEDGLFSPPFDDGSCADLDCHGDCAGQANQTPCGCIGGNTGIDQVCIEGCLSDALGPPPSSCAPFFIKMQEVEIVSTGLLRRVGIDVCCATDAQFVIKEAVLQTECETGNPELAGDILYTSSVLPASCNSFTQCITSTGNTTRYWNVDDFPLEANKRYIIQLVDGVAGSRCDDHEQFIVSYDAFGGEHASSMGLRLDICTEGVGCTDPEASNYDESASQGLPSLCIFPDCAGVPGGPHVVLPGCGCVDASDDRGAILCVDENLALIEASDGPACQTLLSGQTWTAPATGYLRAIQVHAIQTQNFQLTIEAANGPFKGTVLDEIQYQAIPSSDPCNPSPDGWITLMVDSVPIEQGQEYLMRSNQSNLYGNCDNDYALGYGILQGEPTLQDARFRIAVLEDPNVIWGCQDQSKCNYLSAATHDSGVCYEYDCLGQCPDLPDYQPATFINQCGCVGGPDSLRIIEESNCFGCTDSEACNYGPQFITDDGSCNPKDCNGDCLDANPNLTGLAYFNPVCGCVGGNVVDEAGLPVTGLTCGTRCQGNSIASNLDAPTGWSTYLSSGSFQSIQLDTTLYIPSIELFQITAPQEVNTTPFSIIVAKGPTPLWSNATVMDTVECSAYNPVNVFLNSTTYSLYFELNTVLEITPQTYLLVKLGDGNWSCPLSNSDDFESGQVRPSENSNPIDNDLYISIYGCSELFGCTDPTACNFDSWATQEIEGLCFSDCSDPLALNFNPNANPTCTNNLYCSFNIGCADPNACNYELDALIEHPYTGETVECVYSKPDSCLFCPENFPPSQTMSNSDRIVEDSDQDGICNENEIVGCQQESACNYHALATDPAPCIFPNQCAQCSGETDGTGQLILSNDIDLDGICDLIDLCTNTYATNFDSPLNEPCRGECDTAPIMDTVYQITPSSEISNSDAAVQILWHHGAMPNMDADDLIVDKIQLTGLNGSLDFEIDPNNPPYAAQAGYYLVSLIDADGCPWVSEAIHGSTFGQPAASPRLILTYKNCCGNCHILDIDADGICDDLDNCIDRSALNYSSQDNHPCIYSD